MTRDEYLAKPGTVQALNKVRLCIVGTPQGPNLLGFTGVAYGIIVNDSIVVDQDGAPIILTLCLVNLN